MANFQPITYEHYSDKRWQRPNSYHFAAGDVVCRLSAQELSKAAMSLPIAFMSNSGESHEEKPEAESYSLVSVQGLESGKNLFVAVDGRWLNRYIPAVYRGYPFLLVDTDSIEGQQALCIDEDSGVVTEDIEGELFFNEEGKPSPPIAQALQFLSRSSANFKATAKACELLNDHQLIKPWEIKLKHEQGEQTLKGLFCIDEAALNGLDGGVLKELRDTGALQTAFCQMLSMQHLATLPQLAQAHANAAKQAASLKQSSGEITLDALDDGGSINFDNL